MAPTPLHTCQKGAIVFLLIPLALGISPVRGAPADYAAEESDLVSAEELNILYAAIPHRRGKDQLKVTSSFRKSNILKYYIIEKPHPHAPVSIYIIASTSKDGCRVYYEHTDPPFQGQRTPTLSKEMPLEDLCNLWQASLLTTNLGQVSE